MKAVSPQASTLQSSGKAGRTVEFLVEKTASPSRNRMVRIGQKLSSLQSTLDSERTIAKPDSFEASIKHLDDKITRNYQYTEEKYKLVKEQIIKVQEGIATEVIAREILEERKEKELQLVENNIAIELNVDRQERKETAQEALRKVDEKIQAVRIDVITEERERIEEIERQHKIISDQVNNFEKELNEEKRLRADTNETLIRKIGYKISKFQEVMEIEKKVREETENVLFKLLEDIDYKFQTELSKEKKVRERSQDEMMKLLEETCSRIENQLRP